MKAFRSLKSRLTAMVAVAIIVTGTVVLLYCYFIASSSLEDQVYRSMEGVVSRTRRVIQTTNQAMDNLAALVTMRPEIQADLEALKQGTADRQAVIEDLQAVLNAAKEAVPAFGDLFIIMLDGTEVAAVRKRPLDAGRLLDPDTKAKIDDALGVGQTYKDFSVSSGRLLVTVVTGITGGGGDLAGMAVLEGEAQGLEQELMDISGLNSSGELILSKLDSGSVHTLSLETGPTGKTRADTGTLNPVESRDMPQVRSALGGKGEGEGVIDGRKVVYSYESVPEVDWGVTATMSMEQAFAPIYRLRNIVIIVIFVLLFGGILLAFLIARSIARPIEDLQEGVKALAGGDLSTRVTISDGLEVTALAEEFNSMASRLKELYDNLEHKVEERTHELQEANEQLKELDALKSEFVSIASHELRSPLTSMKMGLSTVSKELVGPLNEDQRAMLAIIERNMDRLTQLTTELLDLTKIEARQLDLEVEECDLLELIGEVIEENRAHAQSGGVDLKVVPEEGRVPVRCDRARIHQVLQNLVGNALKFTEDGSVTVSVATEAGSVLVCVEDTGTGIPPEAMGTIFDKFSQAHSETTSELRGTGLGLAICRGIVEAHGGTITAESEPGRGSIFCFTLPVDGPDEREQEDTDSR